MEKWKSVVGYEGLYEVSDSGKIKRINSYSSIGRLLKEKELKPQTHESGHLNIKLYSNGISKRTSVHSIVMAAFIGERPDGMVICHGAGNPKNNHVSNLRYDSQSSNMIDAVNHRTNFNSSKDECRYGHALSGDNLKWSGTRRRCISCKKARNHMRYEKADFQELADRFYLEIKG